MGRMVKQLRDLDIDEVSLVDRPANQHGLVSFTKRQEDGMPRYFDADENEVFQEDLEDLVGQHIYDEAGNQFLVGEEPEPDEEAEEDERELATVGKRQPQDRRRPVAKGGARSLGQSFLEDLSKALNDEDRDKVIAKALDQVGDLVAKNTTLEQQVTALRQEREAEGFLTIAKGYELGDDEAIAGLLHRAADLLPQEDLHLLDRVLTTTSELSKSYLEEIGVTHTFGQASDTLDEVLAMAGSEVAKGLDGMTQEQAVTAIFAANPAAYDAYEADQRNAR